MSRSFLVWRRLPLPGEMASAVCPGEDSEHEETPETRSVASDEDDLDRMHLLDLLAGKIGGGDCDGMGMTPFCLRNTPQKQILTQVGAFEGPTLFFRRYEFQKCHINIGTETLLETRFV